MVGVPRSKGCRICVQRRVRCDQTRPTCNNCKKGNRPCPGYGQDLKFQDEGARLRQRYEGNDQQATACLASAFDYDSSSTLSTPSASHAASSNLGAIQASMTGGIAKDDENQPPVDQDDKHWDVLGLNMSITERRTFLGLLEGKTEAYAKLAESTSLEYAVDVENPHIGILPSRLIEQAFGRNSNPLYQQIDAPDQTQKQLVTKFRQSLFPDNGTIPEAFKNHSRWLSHLPPLTGTNPLLDTSVRAVTLVHIGRLNNSEPFVMESRPYYGKALKLLNKALQDKTAGTANETLCAVILLSFYEMFASENNESWIRHAGGVSALMRARGPQKHRHGFDREIFLAYRYTLVIEAFQENVPCFLAEPAWVKLSSDIHSDLKSSGIMQSRIEIFDLAEEYYASMVKLPELVQNARALWQARVSGTPPPFNRAQVIDKLTQSRVQFKHTFTLFEAALKKSGSAPTVNLNQRDPLIGIEYEYINTFVSATYTGYWTVLAVLNMCLQGLLADDPDMVSLFQTESRDCALNVCRSSAYMLTSSFLGPFFLIFGLRVSLIVFEEEGGLETDWIVRKLFDIGDRHMGIAKHIPGYRAGITVDELIREFREKGAKSKMNRDVSEKMEFARQVANGDVFEQHVPCDWTGNGPREDAGPASGFGTRQSSPHTDDHNRQWPVFNQVEDVLKTWEEQNNFEVHTTTNDMSVRSDTSSGPSPLPTINNLQEQQFSQAAAAFAMPDMNFFDSSFPGPKTAFDGYSNNPSQNLFSTDDIFMSEQQYMAATENESYGARSSSPKRESTLPRGLERFFTE